MKDTTTSNKVIYICAFVEWGDCSVGKMIVVQVCSPKLESQELINTYMSVITVGETVSVEICS